MLTRVDPWLDPERAALPLHFTRMLPRLAASMQRYPLAWLTFIAALPRVVAAFFSEGYFAQDDHFLVIEAAMSWVRGHDYNDWLPWNQQGIPRATGHMMVYPGLHYLLFSLWDWFGLQDPDRKMVLVRLLHAAWSLITVRIGYRIALRLSDDTRIAWRAGLFLALFFFMPFLSVRNLVEMVSAPLLMLSAWWLLKALPKVGSGSSGRQHGPPLSTVTVPATAPAYCLLLAGIFAGLAINIRFQTVFFAGGAGLALLLRREWLGSLVFGIGVIAPIIVLQGGIDLMIWGKPFMEMTEYVRYNLDNPDNTGIVSPWYNYLLLLAGVLIPPLSLAVLFGFAKRPKPLVLWLPIVIFLLFHSIFPNKQERFLLPILPLFFVLGHAAWELWRLNSPWWQRHRALWRGAMVWTWTLNTALLLPLTISSSKLERLEAMRILRRTEGVTGIVVEDTVEHDAPMAPLYYWDVWDLTNSPYTDPLMDMKRFLARDDPSREANTVLFVGDEHLRERLEHAMLAMGPMEYVGCAMPGLLDRTLHWLNPVNRNAVILVFKKKG